MAERTPLWKRNRKTEITSGDRKPRWLSKLVKWGLIFLAILSGWTLWNFSARYDNRIYGLRRWLLGKWRIERYFA